VQCGRVVYEFKAKYEIEDVDTEWFEIDHYKPINIFDTKTIALESKTRLLRLLFREDK